MSEQLEDAGKTEDRREATTVGKNRESLASLFTAFFKMGLTAFGGFMALISVVQNYTVERKKMLRHEDMLDGVSLAMVLPGPVAVNLVAYVGYRLRGWAGAVVTASAVILPSFLLLLLLSYAYFQFGQIPAVGKIFQGFMPAVAAIILAAGWNMGAKAIKGKAEAAFALAATALLLMVGGITVTIGIIVLSGAAGWMVFFEPEDSSGGQQQHIRREPEPQENSGISANHSFATALPWAGAIGLSAASAKLFMAFGGMSLLLFGGGYVFIPLIQRIVVDGYGWVSQQEFIDAIALGQVTPGPILISAAFIGYKVAGPAGAAAATAGIFTPPAIIMVLSTRILDRIKRSDVIKASLRGIRPAVVGMIVAAGFTVAGTAPPTFLSVLIFAAVLVALLRFKIETAWVIPIAGVTGLLLY